MYNLSEISEIKIFSVYSHQKDTEETLNNFLKEGWIILDISTFAPNRLPSGSSYTEENYFTYHLGRTKKKNYIN